MNNTFERPNWSRIMQEANGLFQSEQYDAALVRYDSALALIDSLISGGRPCPGLLMAKIVSHHNRANALIKVSRLGDADTDLACAYAFSKSITEDDRMPEQLRAAARRHCAVCFQEWQAFRSEFGSPPCNRCASAEERLHSLDMAGPVTVH